MKVIQHEKVSSMKDCVVARKISFKASKELAEKMHEVAERCAMSHGSHRSHSSS